MNWVRSQVNFWYGRSYENALLDNWGHTRALLNASVYRKSISQYLTISDVTEQAVIQKYTDLPNYNFQINAEVMADWVGHDASQRLTLDHAFPILMVDEIGPDLPVISYNRSVTHLNAYAILWPLEYHYKIGLKGLDDRRRFSSKISKIVFRGAFSGPLSSFSMSGGYIKVSRLAFLLNAKISPKFTDFGLTFITPQLRISPEYPPIQETVSALLRPTMPLTELFEYKYILCLEGADISTGFGAVLASQSVPIHSYPFCYNVWYFNGLVPWEHFVPVAPDGSNLEAIFLYCESHPEMMRYIIEKGRAHMRRMLNAAHLAKVKEGVVELWNFKG